MDPKSELDRLTDAVYLVYDGNRKGRGCQIVFLHGLQVNHEQEEDGAYLRNCWSSRDGCQLWPKWLAESFPSASIYLVKYDSRLREDDKNRQLDMRIIAEGILSNLLLANIGQGPTNSVILVGQDIGGLVIKEICLQASRHLGEEKKRLFSQQVKGIVYYSTPHLGVHMQFGDCELDAKLANVLTIHNEEIARSNEDFRRLRGKMKWRCIALWPTQVDPLNVEEGTARFDVDIFCPINASAMDICRPEDHSSSSFGELEKFIMDTLFSKRNASRPRLDFKGDPKYVPLLKTSNNIRSWLSDPKRQVVVLVGDAGTGKSGVAKYLALQYDMQTGPEAEFWDGIFYIDCGRGTNIISILRRLLRQLKMQESNIAGTEDVDFLTYLLKENVQDLNALMIFDDVSGDDRSSLVEKLVIPNAENVKYLFTSQESRGWHGFNIYKIDRITVAIGEEIMAKRIGVPSNRIPEADKGIVLKILKATEFHPLALASVAAVVQPNDKGGVDPSEWKEVKKNLLFYLTSERGVDTFGKSYPRSVFAAMMFAVQVLHSKDKILFEALCILALFEGPVPKKVPLLLLLSTKSTLSKHFIPFMKELESRGFVETVAITAESDRYPYFYHDDICVSVPSCKMHSLRQQFMLWFLSFEEDVISFRRSSVEFRDPVDAIQQIISSFLTEASEDPDAHTTVASMSAALCSLFGANVIKRKASSRLPKVANLLCPDRIRKANLGMLMMDIEQDSDSIFLLEMQKIIWKYIVKGEINDVSMAYLIAQSDHKALLFFSLHVTLDSSFWEAEDLEGEGSTSDQVHAHSEMNTVVNIGWRYKQIFSNRKSIEAVFGLLSSSVGTTHELQVQMFVLQLLGVFCPSSGVFQDILVADPAKGDSIKRIVNKLAEFVNATPLVGSEMKNTEAAILQEEDVVGFPKYFGGWQYSQSISSEVHFRDSVIRPVQTILFAVKLIDLHQSLEMNEIGRVNFDEGLVLIESISEPLFCIAGILGQRITRNLSTLHCLAWSVLNLLVSVSGYTDKRRRSSMDFMPNALKNMVSWLGEGSIYNHLAVNVLTHNFNRSSFTSISHFIPMLTDIMKRVSTKPTLENFLDLEALERFLDLFQEWDDLMGICSADKQDLCEVLSTVLSKITETQRAEGWTKLQWKISTVLLLLGEPQEYFLDSSVGIGAIQFQLHHSIDAESRATKRLEGFDILFDIIKDSQCESVQVVALKIMAFLLKRYSKIGARSIFWRSRAIETLAPLLEEQHNEKIQQLTLKILLRMPCREWDTSYCPPDAYSCMWHITSMSGFPMHIFRYFKYRVRKVGRFLAHFLAELEEDGVSFLLDIPDLLKDTIHVLNVESWLSWKSESAVFFLRDLVRYDRSHRVCSQLVTVAGSIETLVRVFKWHADGVFDACILEAVRIIFDSFTSEQRRVILKNPAVKEVMQAMILSLQNSGQNIPEISNILRCLYVFVKEEIGVEHVLSFPGSVEAVIGILIRARKEQVESCSHSLIGIQKTRRKVLVEAVLNSSSLLFELVLGTSQQGRSRIFRIGGFLDLMIDLLDEEQVEDTQVTVLEILWLLSGDPEQQDKLHEFMENRLFHENCSKVLLCRFGRRPDAEAGVHQFCDELSLRIGNNVITETVRSLVSSGLWELVSQLKESDEEQEQQAFLFELLIDIVAEGWVDEIQIGDYFLGAAEALDRLVFTTVYCQQESLRGDALEILGMCVCILEDEESPLQIGGNQRQQQLQMILQTVSTILDQMSVEGHDVFQRFLRRLDVNCRQSLSVILKYPKMVQSLIKLSIQDVDQEARGDALDCLCCFVWSFPSKVSSFTVEDIYLLQELSKVLASIARGTEVDNNMEIQISVVALLKGLIRLASWKYLDESTGSFLSAALQSDIVDDTHVLENLVTLLEGDKPDLFYARVIDILLYAGKNSTRALDHIVQLPRTLEKLVELLSGVNEGRIRQVEGKTLSRAVRLLVFCAVQDKKALSYLTGLLKKHVRLALRVDATDFLIKQISGSTRDLERSLLG